MDYSHHRTLFSSPSTELTSTASALTHSLPTDLAVQSLWSDLIKSGLGMIMSPQYNASTMWDLAVCAFGLESRVATRCYILEAVALIRCFQLFTNKDPNNYSADAMKFGQLTDTSH